MAKVRGSIRGGWRISLQNEVVPSLRSYDMWECPQLHVDRPGYPTPCRCQLCKTLGRVYLKVAIEDSTKKIAMSIICEVTIN